MTIGRVKIEPGGYLLLAMFVALVACMTHGVVWGKDRSPQVSVSPKLPPPAITGPAPVVKTDPTPAKKVTPTPTPAKPISLQRSTDVISANPHDLSLDAVHFRTNSARLDLDGRKLLAILIAQLGPGGAVNISIVGHADSTGKAEYNQRLSERRASSVKRYLEASPLPRGSEVRLAAHGDKNPAGDNQSYAGREMNRRVEIHVKKR